MSKKIMNRRQFLKTAGYLFAGTALARVGKLFGITKDTPVGMKDAKYYTETKKLAG